MNRVPVVVPAVAVIVAVPAARKVAVPPVVMFTTEELSEVQVTGGVAPLAVKVTAACPTLKTTSGKVPTTCCGQGLMVNPVVTVAVAVPLTPL